MDGGRTTRKAAGSVDNGNPITGIIGSPAAGSNNARPALPSPARVTAAPPQTAWIVPADAPRIGPARSSSDASATVVRSQHTHPIGPVAVPPAAIEGSGFKAVAEALTSLLKNHEVFNSSPAEWSVLAFTGEDMNPQKQLIAHAHGVLQLLATALRLPVVHADMTATRLTEGERQVLIEFVSAIPHLPPAATAEIDLQLHGIALARALYRYFECTMTEDARNDVARAAVKIPSSVSVHKHSHGVRAVLLSSFARTSAKYLATPTRAAVSTVFFPLTMSARVLEILARSAHRGFKADRTSNKSLKLLTEVLNSISHGAVANDVFDAAVKVLEKVVPGKGSNRLQKVLQDKATRAQHARHHDLGAQPSVTAESVSSPRR
jgi:hypothetical protein